MSITTTAINYLLSEGCTFNKFPKRKELVSLLIDILIKNKLIPEHTAKPNTKAQATKLLTKFSSKIPDKHSCKSNPGMLGERVKPKKENKAIEPKAKKLPYGWSEEFIQSDQFLRSLEWKRLRVDVIEKYGNKCMMCGNSPPDVVINVDHILPRKLRPDLAMTLSNLQILCGDCNQGKGNRYTTNYITITDSYKF